MKKVLVYAFTRSNLGDDLFLKLLCERYPSTKFQIYAPNQYKISFRKMENLKITPSDSVFLKGVNFLVRKIFRVKGISIKFIQKSSDAVVHIGGSLFMQRDKNWAKKIETTKDRKIKNKPFFLLGANFGPFYDKEYYEQSREIFKGYSDICFREKYSYNLFKDLKNVRIADDIIFQLKKKEVKQVDDKILISVIQPSYRPYLSQYDQIYYQKIKDISIYFIEKGYNVSLMSFCEYEGDKKAVEEILNILPQSYHTKISTYLYKLNMEEALDEIAKSCFIIGTRFHAMILGWVYNKPVYPIAYSEKMTNVMEDINFKGMYSDFYRIHELDPKIVFNSMKTNYVDVSKQVINSERHFEELDKYLLND